MLTNNSKQTTQRLTCETFAGVPSKSENLRPSTSKNLKASASENLKTSKNKELEGQIEFSDSSDDED